MQDALWGTGQWGAFRWGIRLPEVSGSSAIVVGGSGAARANAALVGGGAVSLTGTGTFSLPQLVDPADCAITSDGAASLRIIGVLAGTAGVSVDGVMLAHAPMLITGSSAVAVTGTGRVTVPQLLSGSAAIQVTVSTVSGGLATWGRFHEGHSDDAVWRSPVGGRAAAARKGKVIA